MSEIRPQLSAPAIPSRTDSLALFAVVSLTIAVLWSVGDPGTYGTVLLPMTALLVIFTIFVIYFRVFLLVDNPFFDIGCLYAGVVTLYGTAGLAEYVAVAGNYTSLHDARLLRAHPDPETVGRLAWYYVAHLAVFAVTYLLLRRSRRRGPASIGNENSWDPLLAVAALILYMGVVAFFAVLGQFFDLSASNYLETYLIVKRLPLLLRQISLGLQGMEFVLKLVILAVLFRHFQRYRILVALWLAFVVLSTFVVLGSRTELMLTGLAVLAMYHFKVRRLSLSLVGVLGVVGVFAFSVLGGIRSGARGVEALNPFRYGTEFSAVFANVVDLDGLRASGQIPKWDLRFYLADPIALVPRQLLPFERINQADWYVNTFYPEFGAQGGGLAFGTIAESVVGEGWPDLVLRAVLLGALAACIQRLFLFRGDRFWVFLFYVWALALMYRLFRSSTLYNLAAFVYQFLPAMIGCKVLASLIRSVLAWARARRLVKAPV